MIFETCLIPIGSLVFGFSFYAKEFAESRGLLGQNQRELNPLSGMQSGDTGDTTPVEGAESDGFTNILDNDGSGSEPEDPDDWRHGDEEEGGQNNPLSPASPSLDDENASGYQTPLSAGKKRGFMFSSISSLRSIGSNDSGGGGTMWGSRDSENMVEFGNPMHSDDSDEDGDGGDQMERQENPVHGDGSNEDGDGGYQMERQENPVHGDDSNEDGDGGDQMERQRQTVRTTTT